MRMKVLWTCMIGAMLAVSVMAGPVPVVNINFQLSTTPTPAGYLADSGLPFADRGNGWSYGWSRDISADARQRSTPTDIRYATLVHLQKAANAIWEIAVPNGNYDLFIVCGDADNTDETNTLNVEGTTVTDTTPNGSVHWDEYTLTGIVVADGRLTIQPGTGAANAKICFIDITKIDPTFNPPPVVNAGPDQYFAKPTFPLAVTMAAVVTDENPAQGFPVGVLSYTWSKVSGAGTVSFDNATALNPKATFTTPGEYVLKLAASDGDKSTEDTIVVYINDTSKNMLMAYWNFESTSTTDPNIIDVAKGNNARWVSDDPNLLLRPTRKPVMVPGWVNGSTKAMDFSGPIPSHANVTVVDTEPNLAYGPRYAATLSAWIKVSAFTRDWANVISKGDDSWRLVRCFRAAPANTNSMIVQFTGTIPGPGQPGNGPTGSISVNDNFWHHVCGTYDGEKIRLYVDGVLDVEAPYTGLINQSTFPIQIGGNSQQKSPATPAGQTSGRQWDNIMDEVRVYNYALSETDIRALTAQGKTVPFVDAGTITSPLTYKTGESIPLNGKVLDYGTAGTITALWTTASGPDEAIFASPSSPVTTVKFPAFGKYTLRLTAVDDLASVIDEITVEVVRPTCADVKAAGKLMVGDFDENCHVNLADFALMAADWLRCNDPANYPACFWPFAQ
jgi:hypothetical protein